MKKLLIISTLISGILIMSASSFAQNQNQLRNRFVDEYQKTELAIEQAGNIITASGSDKGGEVLKLAIQTQQKAANFGQNSQYFAGYKLTLEARELAKNALALNQRFDENENLVLRQLEKTDELIDRVDSNADTNVPQIALSLFETSKDNQNQAWEFFRKNQLRPALKLSRQAERTIRGLIEQVQSRKGDLARIQNLIQVLESNYEQIKNRVTNCGNDEALKMLDRAENRYREAVRQYNEGQLKRAENNLKQARKQLAKAVEFCPNDDNLTDRIERIRHELEKVSQIAISAGSSQALELTMSASEHLKKAETLCAEGRNKGCVANLRAAEISLDKARKILEL